MWKQWRQFTKMIMMMKKSVKTEGFHALGGATRQDMTLHPIPGISYVKCHMYHTYYTSALLSDVICIKYIIIGISYVRCNIYVSYIMYQGTIIRCYTYYTLLLSNLRYHLSYTRAVKRVVYIIYHDIANVFHMLDIWFWCVNGHTYSLSHTRDVSIAHCRKSAILKQN